MSNSNIDTAAYRTPTQMPTPVQPELV